MQENSYAFPHWLFQLLQGIALFGAGGLIVKLITLWQHRRLPAVAVQKLEAETTEITIRSHSTAGDSLTRMMDRLELAQTRNDELREEIDDLQQERDKQAMELESYDRQMRKMKAMLDLKGIKMSDFDEPPES